ncbi:MAG: class I SAM-dependent methyltransferase [Thermomicrobiales bacterium]
MSVPNGGDGERRRATWDDAAKGWHDWTPMIEEWLGSITEEMLDVADVRAGSRVLDVAAGSGSQSLLAAHRVGLEGFVLATDFSAPFVAYAEEEIRRAGITNIAARMMDAEHLDVHDETFDAAICRLGVMFFPHPVKALAEMRRVLRPGGKAAVIVFSVPERNFSPAAATAAIRRAVPLPPPQPGQPGLFALAQPDALGAAYVDAGFRDVQTRIVATTQSFSSAEECVAFLRTTVVQALLAGASEDQQEMVWSEVAEAHRQFEGVHGCDVPYELLLAVGTK